eukprot:UN23767
MDDCNSQHEKIENSLGWWQSNFWVLCLQKIRITTIKILDMKNHGHPVSFSFHYQPSRNKPP